MLCSLALVIAIAGCGDDDNPVVTQTLVDTLVDTVTVVQAGPSMMIFSAIYLSDSVLGGYMEIWDHSYSGTHPDSIVVGASVLEDLERWYWSPDDHYWSASLWDLYDSSFASGDTVTVKLYYNDEMAMVSLEILDREWDSVVMVTEPTSPIMRGDDVELMWNSFDGIDFYGVSVSYEVRDEFDNYTYFYDDWAITDTMITIPGTSLDYEGSMSYQVYPYRGPLPTAEGVVPPNIDTPSMSGHIWTYGDGNYRSVTVSDPPMKTTVDSNREKMSDPDDILRKAVLR